MQDLRVVALLSGCRRLGYGAPAGTPRPARRGLWCGHPVPGQGDGDRLWVPSPELWGEGSETVPTRHSSRGHDITSTNGRRGTPCWRAQSAWGGASGALTPARGPLSQGSARRPELWRTRRERAPLTFSPGPDWPVAVCCKNLQKCGCASAFVHACVCVCTLCVHVCVHVCV